MSKAGINLLKASAAPQTFWEKFFVWALSIGRFIIVGTEAIVLMVFLARFKIDRDINDLADSLETKKAILNSYTDIEQDIRTLQSRLYKISSLREGQDQKADNYGHLISLITDGTIVNSLRISDKTVTVDATAESFDAFKDFENSFKDSKLLKNVTVPSTETKDDDGKTIYQFTLKAVISS